LCSCTVISSSKNFRTFFDSQKCLSLPEHIVGLYVLAVNCEETKQHERTDDTAAATATDTAVTVVAAAEADAVSGSGEREADAVIDRVTTESHDDDDDEIHTLNGATSQSDDHVSTAATTVDDIVMGGVGETEADAVIDRVAESRDIVDDEIHVLNGSASAPPPQSDEHVSAAESADVNVNSHESSSAVELSSDVNDESVTMPVIS